MDFSNIPTNLDITLYGKEEQITPTLTKCRVRIFYKGMNRNRTYISEDFANQLIASLPYTPIKGIFNKEEIDFEDHGDDNTDGRIYGIVPAEPNFAWESHLDEDGIQRIYACSDVFLFTGLYPEAKLISGESQSMEIFRDNLEGEWKISEEDGDPYYHFKKGCLVGLQILGKEIEPCFEGASFFSQLDPKIINEIIEYAKKIDEKGENKEMETKTLFRLSDNQKARIIETLVNPKFNEENSWKQERIVLDIYDDYALCGNLETGGYERVYYTKEGDNITIGDALTVYVIDVTDSEKEVLDSLKNAAGGTYEAINTEYNNAVEKIKNLESEKIELENKINEFENKANENETAVAEFNSKIEGLNAEKVEMEKKLSDIQNENKALIDFKKQIEKEKKQAILIKYEEHLTETAIANFKNTMDNYSVDDFKKEVCTMAVESDSTFFSKKDNESSMFYKGDTSNQELSIDSPAIRLLNKYKNGGNK